MKGCRACLAQATDKNCVNVKAEVIDETDVLEAIKEVASLEGSHNDFLPKFICKKCFKLLKTTTVFRRKIIDSYGQLMSKLKSNVSIACLELISANEDENIIKIEEVFLPEGSQDRTDKECTSENVGAQNCNVENQICSEQNTYNISSTPAVAVTRNTKKIINQQNIGQYENEIVEENIKLNKLFKFVKRKRKREKNIHNFQLELHQKGAEPIKTTSKKVLKINAQECALKELGDKIQLSSQKKEEGSDKAASLIDSKAGKSKSNTKTLGIRTCTVCGMVLKGKKKYGMHMKAHSTDLPPLEYVCPICPKRYPKKEYLLVHTRSHTGEKPYHCDICDKNFSQFATYHVHKKRLHDKVIQGTCSYCGKMFVDKPELDVHIKTWHTGERPYLCEFCSATFVCNRTLQRHRKEIHSEKKPCQKCGKMLGDYALKKHLVRHQVVEEGLKIVRKKYTCEYCKTVMNFTSRRRHLERQHGIKLHGRGDDCTKVSIKETDEKEVSVSPGIP